MAAAKAMAAQLARWLTLFAGVLVLGACGGGAGGGAPTSGGAPTVAALRVTVSNASLSADSTNPVTVTVVAKDSSNRVVSGQAIDFSISDPQGLQSSDITVVGSGVTDANGVATAAVSNVDPTSRAIVVTARAGAITSTGRIDVVGTSVNIDGPTSVSFNSTALYTVTVRSASGVPFANRLVTLTSSAGNPISPSSMTTDGSGQAIFAVTPTVSGSDTLRVSSTGVFASFGIQTSTSSVLVSSPVERAELPINAGQPVVVVFSSSSGSVANQNVVFSTTRGTLSSTSGVTDSQGRSTVSVSSIRSGPATLTASINGISVQRQVEFVATQPASISLQVALATIPLNVGSAQTSRTTLRAQVFDSQNNPVKNQLVNFSASVDPSGGSIFPPSATTDSSGYATVAFIAGPRQTAREGVTLEARLPTTSGCTICTSSASMTVSGNPLFVSVGTGNLIAVPNSTIYQRDYAVKVTDSSGAPVRSAKVSISLTPDSGTPIGSSSRYWKGFWVWDSAAASHIQFGRTECENEDKNLNGQLDIKPNGDPEDENGDGRLWPGNFASISFSAVFPDGSGAGLTDENGEVTASIRYAKEFAYWAEMVLTVRAFVDGSGGGIASVPRFLLQGLDSDYSSESLAPPGSLRFVPFLNRFAIISPFGYSTSCTDPK